MVVLPAPVGPTRAMVWPGYGWFGNRIEPYVLGLPFSLFWIILWVLLSLLALTLYHASSQHQE